MCSLPEVKIILLSGGIGSGKSTAAAVLLSCGIPVYDADSKAKALYLKDNGLVEALEARLHTGLKDMDGAFDKGKLAAFLFREDGGDAIAAVEEIVFPYLEKDFLAFAQEHADRGIVAMESATILEKEYFNGFGDYRIVVDAPYEMRLERACRRDGASREEVMARMAHQPLMNRISAGEAVPGIDAVILNDSTLEVLASRVKEVLSRLD